MARIDLDLTRMQTTYVANAIRERSSERYQSIVPIMTDSSRTAMAGAILSEGTVTNEFVQGLLTFYVDPIVTTMYYENNLRRFKMPLQRIGGGFVEYYTPPVEGANYDASGANVDTPSTIVNKNKVYKVNSQRTFKTTIYERDIRACFASESGAYDFIMRLVDAVESGMEKEEYINMRNIFTTANTDVAFPTLPAVSNSASDIMKAIRAAGLKMQFPSTVYNAAGNENTTRPEDLVIFTTPDNIALVDVDLLATAFNMDKTDWISSVIVVDSLPAGIQNAVALLGDYRFLKVRDTKYKWASRFNEAGDFINVFLHKDTIYEYSPFVNMVAITYN